MLIRAILPDWRSEQMPSLKRVVEADLSEDEILKLNEDYYNIYYLPNSPSELPVGRPVDGTDIDQFQWVFVDMDLKDGAWGSKEAFLEFVLDHTLAPTSIVDSGNGIHVYWKVEDLDAMGFLRLQRRLCREFKTDEVVSKIYQLMRLPGYVNTKKEENLALCSTLVSEDRAYAADAIDRLLKPITLNDELYCKQHFEKTYNRTGAIRVDDRLPTKFAELIRNNSEVKSIWSGEVDDRSRSDFRLAHIMFANGFTREEARSVLVNSAKALSRAPIHRVNYAENIINKIWTYETCEVGSALTLSSSVADILSKSPGAQLKGTRFPCSRWLDDTEHGFRLGQVIGLIAGVGVGKTAVALNAFMGFVRNNPDYIHFFVPLEQPKEEIADRWQLMCGEDTSLHGKVQILSNYADDGSYRNLSLDEIQDYIVKFQEQTGKKVGAVVIDHIAILKKQSKTKEGEALIDICHKMKAFAVKTNTMLIMQSQAPREKAGIGDLELNKDAAYGTVFFEAYCDYLVTIWQPLKRCYKEPACPTVTAFKFCKIRHKRQGVDKMQEDVPYLMYYDPRTHLMATLTQDQEKSFQFFNQKATNDRKKDRKTDLVVYTKITVSEGESDGATKDSGSAPSARGSNQVH